MSLVIIADGIMPRDWPVTLACTYTFSPPANSQPRPFSNPPSFFFCRRSCLHAHFYHGPSPTSSKFLSESDLARMYVVPLAKGTKKLTEMGFANTTKSRLLHLHLDNGMAVRLCVCESVYGPRSRAARMGGGRSGSECPGCVDHNVLAAISVIKTNVACHKQSQGRGNPCKE